MKSDLQKILESEYSVSIKNRRMKTEALKVLIKLVELKEHKEKFGKTPHYEKEKKVLWKNAKDVVEKLKGYGLS